MSDKFDALVVGSGPNGMAAAITLARAGLSVKMFEANSVVGGGVRSSELTLPGFLHDTCSAAYPMAALSSFFQSLPGIESQWITPSAAFAHPLDDGTAVLLPNELAKADDYLEQDGAAWRKIFDPFVDTDQSFINDLLSPLGFPSHPFLMARFGINAIHSVKGFADKHFSSPRTKALVAGVGGHSLLSFDQAFGAAPTMALTLAAHKVGWPLMNGGAQNLSTLMAEYFQSLGGQIETNARIDSLRKLPKAKIVLLNISAKNLSSFLGDTAPHSYHQKLARFKSGPGIFKIDWALSEPVPWKAKECKNAATVHLGGSFDEIAMSEHEVAHQRVAQNPFVLAVQPTLFDASRSPAGKHILWAYCHVPFGCTESMEERIENQVERFAPGFKDCILAKKITTPSELESTNANYVGGDISGGAMSWAQIFSRPTSWYKPYRTPIPNVYLCSSSTPPGPGVHGMCGYHAAKLALHELNIRI